MGLHLCQFIVDMQDYLSVIFLLSSRRDGIEESGHQGRGACPNRAFHIVSYFCLMSCVRSIGRRLIFMCSSAIPMLPRQSSSCSYSMHYVHDDHKLLSSWFSCVMYIGLVAFITF